MHKEVAIEPAYLSSFERVRFVMSQCGFDQGRLISEFPKRTWQKLVLDAASGCPDIEKKKIEVELRRADEWVIRTGRNFDKGDTWTGNAKREHSHIPFHGVVTNGQTHLGEGFINGDDLHAEHPNWKVNTDCRIKRNAAEMAACAEVLLRQAKQVHFVDPYFGISRKYVEPLCRFIEFSWVGKPIQQMGYHFSQTRDERWDPASFEKGLMEEFYPRIQNYRGIKLFFFRWYRRSDQVSDGMHARYILTDVGGLSFDHGLDEGPNMTNVIILPKSGGVYRSEWPKFSAGEDSSEVESVWELSLQGLRKLR